MTSIDPKPAKRGPGRPRKNPPPDQPPVEKAVEAPATEADELDWPQLFYELMLERAAPATAKEIAEATDFELAEAVRILDALVSDGRLVLGPTAADDDTERYFIPGSVTLAAQTADSPDPPDPSKAEPRPDVVTVNIPTSSIYEFLTHLNLPPEYTAGLGALSGLSGILSFEVPPDPDPAQPADLPVRASAALRVVLTGTHTRMTPALNPNQPGYLSATSTASLTAQVEP